MKKVLATILALMMVFSGVSAFAGDFDNISASDIETAVADLNNTKVMVGDANGDFRGEATITRAEFAVILCRIAGLEDLAKRLGNGSSFADVQGHWAAGYIEAAKTKGLINGYSADKFGPQDPVTVGQISKMLVSLLGYEDRHVIEEGFPYGYANRATNIGLAGDSRIATRYLENLASVPATRNFVAYMVSNALDVPLRDYEGFVTSVQDVPDGAWIVYDGLNGREYITLRTTYFSN